MFSLRIPETQARYDEHKKTPEFNDCPLCRAVPVEEFTYWKIIPNEFPYDRVAKQHDMVVLKRHASEEELTDKESEEFKHVRKDLLGRETYNYIMEATNYTKSIPPHAHWHLICLKDEE